MFNETELSAKILNEESHRVNLVAKQIVGLLGDIAENLAEFGFVEESQKVFEKEILPIVEKRLQTSTARFLVSKVHETTVNEVVSLFEKPVDNQTLIKDEQVFDISKKLFESGVPALQTLEDYDLKDTGKKSAICPLTKTRYLDPVRVSPCGHVFSKSSLEALVAEGTTSCPVYGCSSVVDMTNVVSDEETIKLLNKLKRKLW